MEKKKRPYRKKRLGRPPLAEEDHKCRAPYRSTIVIERVQMNILTARSLEENVSVSSLIRKAIDLMLRSSGIDVLVVKDLMKDVQKVHNIKDAAALDLADKPISDDDYFKLI